MIPKHLIDVDTDDAVAESIAEHRGFIRALAWKMGKDDVLLRDDLEQEAAIHLWKLDPTRFDASDRKYLRRALYTRMLQVLRSERRASGGKNRLSLSPP